jgi:methylated-DNA-protein-cysteine methyltransferase-like protein
MAPKPTAGGTALISGSVCSTYKRIYAVVQRIPKGRVATYGQVADLAGISRHARQVGYALHALEDGSSIPWHRVVNARGTISRRTERYSEPLQHVLLEREGVTFDFTGHLDLAKYRWRPRMRSHSKAAE